MLSTGAFDLARAELDSVAVPTTTTESPSMSEKSRRKWPWILGGVLLLFIIGIAGGNDKNSE